MLNESNHISYGQLSSTMFNFSESLNWHNDLNLKNTLNSHQSMGSTSKNPFRAGIVEYVDQTIENPWHKA